MAPVTIKRTLGVPGLVISDGILYAEPFTRRSAIFVGGGYDWSIRYYATSRFEMDSIDLCLQLETMPASGVTASFSVVLLDPTGGLPPWKLAPIATAEFNPNNSNYYSGQLVVTMHKSFLNMAPDPRYLTRGGLLFECTITVFTETPAPMPDTTAAATPASDMMEQLGKIYASGDGADVTYSVQGKLFRAHKIILAMRSPVFKAQLYGGMMESTALLIEVADMLPDVFRALLRTTRAEVCDRDREDMIRECKKFEVFPAEPKIPPSAACCAVWQRADIPCLCKRVTKEIEKVWCMEKVTYVAERCGRPFQPGYKCGSK
ncbi:hypothetical protein BAE44_0018767 [Dichanthelium oligosanthes]|uniref:BTB domain-containing protein n=1 Tax=Dichanthelium oligosanthes TaxID=888268 RepID=A0A1E5V596_9POAL|nr:hypothetical protein BAE44_0018767 [Dichanthelium oligosanthes]